MKYFKIVDEGYHHEWGEPMYWYEVNEDGNAERQLEEYPNGNVVSFDRDHSEDEHGALSVWVVNGDEDWWISYKITKDEFEQKWNTHSPLNRTI